MRFEVIFKHLAFVLLMNSVLMMVSFFISLYYHETSTSALLYSTLICLIFSIFPLLFYEKTDSIQYNEGLAIIVFGWLLTCVAGMLPYIMWGGEFTLVNAFFESVSGFTTTGSTILTDVESLPMGILFWRSSTQWIGGIGIILVVLLILPSTKTTGIFNSEVNDITKMIFNVSARKTINILVLVYIGLTFSQTLLLMASGMGFFDAINHSFTTISTGGFSTKNLSILSYDSFWIEMIITLFMFLSAIHFGLIYATFIGNRINLFTSSLVRAFAATFAIASLAIALKLYLAGDFGFWVALRHAVFQVVSLGSSTGFASIDTLHWPIFTQFVLMYITFQNGMSGSTAGGIKFDRIFIFFKLLGKQFKLLRHPKGIFITKIDNIVIREQLEQQTLVFMVLFIFITLASAIILSMMNIDGMTSFSAAVTAMSNCGPGFGGVSNLGNFSAIPDAGKLLLSFNMLLGRLEIMNILAFFMLIRK